MNQNDMDRYYWRTGQLWGADERSKSEVRGPILKVGPWALVILGFAFIGTTVVTIFFSR